jgi:hypothetical protein
MNTIDNLEIIRTINGEIKTFYQIGSVQVDVNCERTSRLPVITSAVALSTICFKESGSKGIDYVIKVNSDILLDLNAEHIKSLSKNTEIRS